MNISEIKDAVKSFAESMKGVFDSLIDQLKDLLLMLRGGVTEDRPLGPTVDWVIEDVNPRGIVLRNGVHRERYSREELWKLLTGGVMRFEWGGTGG